MLRRTLTRKKCAYMLERKNGSHELQWVKLHYRYSMVIALIGLFVATHIPNLKTQVAHGKVRFWSTSSILSNILYSVLTTSCVKDFRDELVQWEPNKSSTFLQLLTVIFLLSLTNLVVLLMWMAWIKHLICVQFPRGHENIMNNLINKFFLYTDNILRDWMQN